MRYCSRWEAIYGYYLFIMVIRLTCVGVLFCETTNEIYGFFFINNEIYGLIYNLGWYY